MSKLKRKIRDGIKKDINSLLQSLLIDSSDDELIRNSVADISILLEKESLLTEDKKKLSRKIGTARAQGEDTTQLIAGVSEISGKIKQLEVELDQQVAQILSLIHISEPTRPY